jgi:hypothetical protein
VLAAVLSFGGCCHLQPPSAARDVPFEIFQESHLGAEWRVEEVQYSLEGAPMKTWRPSAASKGASPNSPVVSDVAAAGPGKLDMKIVAVHTSGLAVLESRREVVVRLASSELLAFSPGLRSRFVLRLCPLDTADQLRAISLQFEAAYYRMGASPPFVRGACLVSQPPAAPPADER